MTNTEKNSSMNERAKNYTSPARGNMRMSYGDGEKN
jgi:hypothetical protein